MPASDSPATDTWLLHTEQRPASSLLTYYAITSLVLGPLFFVLLIPAYFRYRTLRYRFDEEGVSASWGILFRREISLNYARVQDIHLVSNIVERWLGLARVQVQTASGSAAAELTIEGLPEFAEIRQFLYQRMRGSRALPAPPAARALLRPNAEPEAEVADTMRAVAEELRLLREALAPNPAARAEAERRG